jgi:hypothetical protein
LFNGIYAAAGGGFLMMTSKGESNQPRSSGDGGVFASTRTGNPVGQTANQKPH